MTAELIPPNPDQNYFADPALDFQAQQAKLERRRKLAESLVANAMQSNGNSGMAGGVYMVGNQYGNLAQSIGGNVMSALADRDQQALSTRQRQAEDAALGAIPSEGPERTQAQLKALQQMPSLRETLKMQMGVDEQERNRIEKGAQEAANRVEKEANANAQRDFLAAQGDLNRQNRLDSRAMPTIHISQGGAGQGQGKAPSGYRWKADGTGLEAIPGGPHDVSNSKPVKLTAAQQKAYDDSDALLGHIDNSLELLKNNPDAIGFKTILPDMALSKIDPQGVATRAAVAGLSAERVHQLSGAAVSPAEFARLRPYLPASGDTAEAVQKKLTSLKGEVERIKAAHARGPTMANPDAKAPSDKLTPAEQAELDQLRAKHGRK